VVPESLFNSPVSTNINYCFYGIVFNVPEGCYLMLGDNRNHSSDARVWKHDAIAMGMSEEEADKRQYINKSDIIGKAVFRYWPITEMKFF